MLGESHWLHDVTTQALGGCISGLVALYPTGNMFHRTVLTRLNPARALN